MSTTRKPLTDDERDARRAAERELTEQAVEQLRTSGGWQRWLRVRRHFHSYSLGNQLLISLQAPHATHVAGFRAWLNMGYAVNRGEHGLRIWMPLPPSKTKIEAWRAAGGDPSERPRVLFKLGVVFDRSQVSPLPPPTVPLALDPPIARVEGDELAHLHGPLEQFATSIGYRVSIEPLRGPEGTCSHRERLIKVEQALAANGQIAALLHELAHALVRVDRTDGDPKLSYAAEELVVESVAYSVAATAGIDTSANSVPYLAAWSEETPIATIHAHAELIDRLARRIEDAIDSDPTTSKDDQPG
jgi:hypothetical protein